MKEEGRVLIGDTVVGVAEWAWFLPLPVGAEEEKSSQAEMTSRL